MQVGAGQEPGAAVPGPVVGGAGGGAQHESGEVDPPRLALRGGVGAGDVAELALVALVDDGAVLLVGEEADVAGAVVARSIMRNRSLNDGQNFTQRRQSEQTWKVRSRSARVSAASK